MDKVFKNPIEKQFEFDEKVASVFDDMLERSIPFYKEVIELICKLIDKEVDEDSLIVDLGCSTANTLLQVNEKTKKKLRLIGYDNSDAMLSFGRRKIDAYGAKIELRKADILNLDLQTCDVVIANYMLQFIRPMQRVELINKIYKALDKDGIFIFSEKIIFGDKRLDKQMIDIYYDFKKSQGYSGFEIAQKREALENVLVPYTEKENIKMIQDAKFKSVEIIFKWGNFVTFLAKK